MFIYSKRSLNNLRECHIDLQTIAFEAIKEVDICIICGHRDKEDQDKAFKDGGSDLKFPNSKHNKEPSHAFDMIPCLTNGKHIDWKDKATFCYVAGHIMSIARRLYKEGRIPHRLRWGGDWKMVNIADGHDLGHFELVEGK